ncbi:MAG: TetM/TetW/TetO/TetS family tetracycline resistance ribosomal protection protein [Lachnospiraceae bacterium]|nr:TetM/TetW/TetO/TetS family tetracycline resistance ribosomal protection protein [Lachnospiraceae bacterium]
MSSEQHICIGLLAHVDSGKTTLAESILYARGAIRKQGRVDHGDAFLDTDQMEKARGITIFSKEARVRLGEYQAVLLDTPGHTDFGAEMERALQVLDYAVLVISGSEGIQSHVITLWRLLEKHSIPVFIFVNKMDLPGCDREALMGLLKRELSDDCVDFTDTTEQNFTESAAERSEELLELYLQGQELPVKLIGELVFERRIFPCYFGSALKNEGVEELLKGMETYMLPVRYPREFGARVYKISRDEKGNRLTHMKVTGGKLRVKDLVGEEKINQIRLCSGADYEQVSEVRAGELCAVTGLAASYSGQGLGFEREQEKPSLEPVLNYRVILPDGCDVHQAYLKIKQLEEEDPQLKIVWEERSKEIRVQFMGEVQIEIVRAMIRERFYIEASFGEGSIIYKETIASPVEGVGHFEPLRHYAEVHLWMEPGEAGSGLTFDSICSEDVLDRNWQRLILTHLKERRHKGVLTGSDLTDVKITLVAGRAHPKHTEGGDFRQATYRAVREGLMKAENVLLEPVYDFELTLPAETVGRAMSDISRMSGSFTGPVMTDVSEAGVSGETDASRSEGNVESDTGLLTAGMSGRPEQAYVGMATLSGRAPVAAMQGYQREVASYTRGLGRLRLRLAGYAPCHNTEEVLAASDYLPEEDVENTADSVFCAHGAGFVVPWDQVEEYMHLETGLMEAYERERETDNPDGQAADGKESLHEQRGIKTNDGDLSGEPANEEEKNRAGQRKGKENVIPPSYRAQRKAQENRSTSDFISQEEIDAIFARTYGTTSRKREGWERTGRAGNRPKTAASAKEYVYCPQLHRTVEEYLLVDGYNIIFAWEELSAIAAANIDGARDRLADILCNYQGYRKVTVILVFDAYRVAGHRETVQKYNNIYIVYTKEAETADHYIEKTVRQMAGRYKVTVATSDRLEQMIIWGRGATRLSARGLLEEIERTGREIGEYLS